MKTRLKPYVLPIIYLSLVLILTLVVFYTGLTSNLKNDNKEKIIEEQEEYVNDEIEVIDETNMIQRPYDSDSVKIGRGFYDYKDKEENQEKAIITYDDTYLQNSGIDYISKDKFKVLNCIDGTVINVQKTELNGYIVEVKSNDNFIISYQSLEDVKVKQNDKLTTGMEIGTTTTTELDKELGNHLHIEMYVNGSSVNPEEYYNKELKNI